MKYTGNRYVPKVLSTNDSWSKDNSYESLTVVCWQGASFTSRAYVPKGVDISNTDYWACTGNYDAQVEQYRNDTNNAIINVNNKLDTFSATQDGKFQVLLDTYKTDINNYFNGKYAEVTTQINSVYDGLNTTKGSIQASMDSFEDSIQATTDNYTRVVNNQMQNIQNMLTSIDIVYDAGLSTDIDSSDIVIIDGGV